MTEQQVRLTYSAKALSYIGAKRGDSRHREILSIYNSFKPLPRGYKMQVTDPWCACFVSACAIATGMDDIIPIECSCSRQIEQLRAAGCWQEKDSYVPHVGDLIYYDWQDSGVGDNRGTPDHVGIVSTITGTEMLIVEGNKGSTSVVGYRKVAVDAKHIRGFGTPDFAAKATAPTCKVELPTINPKDKCQAVKAMQALLNIHGAKLAVDGSYGPLTQRAFSQFQFEHNLPVTLCCDARAWQKLICG